MNIILTIHKIYNKAGGAQKSLVELANALYARGHDVSVIIAEPDIAEENESFFFLEDGVTVHNVLGNLEYNKADITDGLFMNGVLTGDKYSGLVQQTRSIITQIKPDIVISFMQHSFMLISKAIGDLEIPIVFAHRDDPARYYKYGIINYKYLDLFMKKAAANVIQLKEFGKYFQKEILKRTCVIPNVVECDAGIGIVKTEKNNDVKIIISVGRLVSCKNHELLIRAFNEIAHEYKEWIVKIFGEGEESGKLNSLIKTLGLENRVFIMENSKKIREELLKSDIFAFPSRFEGFSRALTEAMAIGLPAIVIRDSISNSSLIKQSEGGLIAENSLNDFSQKIDILIRDSEKRKLFGLNSMHYIKRYKPEKVYPLWEELIENVSCNKPVNTWEEYEYWVEEHNDWIEEENRLLTEKTDRLKTKNENLIIENTKLNHRLKKIEDNPFYRLAYLLIKLLPRIKKLNE